MGRCTSFIKGKKFSKSKKIEGRVYARDSRSRNCKKSIKKTNIK